MADMTKTSRPLTRASVREAHDRIKPYIHHTPVLTCDYISTLASTPQPRSALEGTEYAGQEPARPKMNIFFKCENYQRIGAFKARGAFHALSRLTDKELERGVITHSSGNHAQALALAAKTRGVPAYIIMPTISTPSKIAATQAQGAEVHFSGSTAPEREALLKEVQEKTGAIFVPPYDHPDIILGQGTLALEFEEQVQSLLSAQHTSDTDRSGYGWSFRAARQAQKAALAQSQSQSQPDSPSHQPSSSSNGSNPTPHDPAPSLPSEGLDAVIAPCGGGGMLSGVATALTGTGISVYGAEPSHSGADDARRGLASTPPQRITHVSTLTIADGLRTPVGLIPWSVISDRSKVRGVFSVSEEQIRKAMRLVLERMKVLVEPSAVVGLAVALWDEGFRRVVEREGGSEGWNVGVVLSGGNTTVEAIAALFAEEKGEKGEKEKGVGTKEEREEGTVGMDGKRVAQDVAG